MKLTIFSRLLIAYLAIFFLVMAVNVYVIAKLRQFNQVTRHIMNTEYGILESGKKLGDSFLSQVRYERKYIVTPDDDLRNQFLSARDEFNRSLTNVLFNADTLPKRESIKKVKSNYDRYLSLVEEEVDFVNKKEPYPKEWYHQEKEKVTDAILGELKNLEIYSQKDIYENMNTLKDTGSSARRMALIMAVIALCLVLTISFLATRSITKPLALLIDKTREVSKGSFKGGLAISSPPEFRKLTIAFNMMCDQLAALDKMKSDFFSSMSHELRTPLTSIKEGTALLQEGLAGSVSEKQRKILTIISQESRRLINLVNSLLDLSKMEAGMMSYRFEQSNLSVLIDKAVTEIGPLAEAKKISLGITREDGLPCIRMDQERVLQVLRNLIGNAVKFTPANGQVKISARPVDQKVEVSVSDTGPGIPEEYLHTIFEKFHQASAGGSVYGKGTGLGLAIVKHIIISHGGKVWAESELGQGSRFIFVLPA
jgi:two-component system sensor histidine kinase GlrK